MPAVTQPSPMTHFNKLKSASDFHSLYFNFPGGGSYPSGVCGAPHSPSTHSLPPGSAPHRVCYRPDLFSGLGTQQFSVTVCCTTDVPVEFSLPLCERYKFSCHRQESSEPERKRLQFMGLCPAWKEGVSKAPAPSLRHAA